MSFKIQMQGGYNQLGTPSACQRVLKSVMPAPCKQAVIDDVPYPPLR
ncbi:MAG: hypothetical protein LBD29_10320 [Treponema sp.]|jgi:hypothetical protein|nr:hypothetical protein [Treponema sp.]